jgi:hypothetical protein
MTISEGRSDFNKQIMEADQDQKREWVLKEEEVAQLGEHTKKIGEIITTISKPLFEKPPKQMKEGDEGADDEDEEFDEDDDEVMSGIEQKMAADIKKTLDKELGGNWNALVGNRFNTLINRRKEDHHGTFTFGCVKIEVFQMNNY